MQGVAQVHLSTATQLCWGVQILELQALKEMAASKVENDAGSVMFNSRAGPIRALCEAAWPHLQWLASLHQCRTVK